MTVKYTQTPASKICPKCGIDKDKLDFGKRPDGILLRSHCLTCEQKGLKERRSADMERTRRWGRKHDKKRHTPERTRNTMLKTRYGLTHEEYLSMLNSQNNRCAICEADETRRGNKNFCIDHCHESNKIRAILCSNCNSALGLFKDSPELMEKAAEYIRFHKANAKKAA